MSFFFFATVASARVKKLTPSTGNISSSGEDVHCYFVTSVSSSGEDVHCYFVISVSSSWEDVHCYFVTSVSSSWEDVHCYFVTSVSNSWEDVHCYFVTSVMSSGEDVHCYFVTSVSSSGEETMNVTKSSESLALADSLSQVVVVKVDCRFVFFAFIRSPSTVESCIQHVVCNNDGVSRMTMSSLLPQPSCTNRQLSKTCSDVFENHVIIATT